MTVRLTPLLAALVVAAATAGFVIRPGTGEPRQPPTLPPPAASAAAGAEHRLPFGPVSPASPLPSVALAFSDGRSSDLSAETRGRWTVMQLMFAGCTSTCPIQGAIFQQAQADLADVPVAFLSISVDPVGDTPPVLAAWLDRFGAGPSWRAAAPALQDLGPLLDVLVGRGQGIDVHGAAAYLVDPEGRLVYMTESMPSPETIGALVREAVGSGASGT